MCFSELPTPVSAVFLSFMKCPSLLLRSLVLLQVLSVVHLCPLTLPPASLGVVPVVSPACSLKMSSPICSLPWGRKSDRTFDCCHVLTRHVCPACTVLTRHGPVCTLIFVEITPLLSAGPGSLTLKSPVAVPPNSVSWFEVSLSALQPKHNSISMAKEVFHFS